jgi:hypothetical protein
LFYWNEIIQRFVYIGARNKEGKEQKSLHGGGEPFTKESTHNRSLKIFISLLEESFAVGIAIV